MERLERSSEGSHLGVLRFLLGAILRLKPWLEASFLSLFLL